MTDRELLELAAKAARIVGEYRRFHQSYGDQWVEGIQVDEKQIFWNPLAYDDDALRLAVTLSLDINFGIMVVEVLGDCYVSEHFGSSPQAATRRAIVRAAAEIGKSMP